MTQKRTLFSAVCPELLRDARRLATPRMKLAGISRETTIELYLEPSQIELPRDMARISEGMVG